MPRRTVTVIGSIHRREFRSLIEWMNKHPELSLVEHNVTIEGALKSDNRWVDKSDLVIVLQSWPTQYPRSDIDRLVGQTLFRRLMCCYGPWCESNARNRGWWPEAQRISLRLACRMIDWEIARMATSETILPTSSRNEVFAYRLGEPSEWSKTDILSGKKAAIISPDFALRKTLEDILQSFGMQASSFNLLRQKIPLPVDFVVHDLDPWGATIQSSLQFAVQGIQTVEFFGLATMPDGGLQTELEDIFQLTTVIPKLDLEDSLRWQLIRAADRSLPITQTEIEPL